MELKRSLCSALAVEVLGINRTFMELKLTLHRQTEINNPSINRTFMELKPVWCNTCKSCPVRINRTFMELKPDKRPLRLCQREYQSNLYGIETGLLLPRFGIGRVYQSNLYGIETRDGGVLCRSVWVSIEPLWNWNSLDELSDLNTHLYQSNLYGIETIIMFCCIFMMTLYQSNLYGIETMLGRGCGWSVGVSIEPLWNWNVAANVATSSGEGINRTFMELKPGHSEKAKKGNRVSIEPLWNWNVLCVSCRQRWRQYQSNLYGIETSN